MKRAMAQRFFDNLQETELNPAFGGNKTLAEVGATYLQTNDATCN
jgi:cystathionine beta-lyase/cystathionine gamma-synthase